MSEKADQRALAAETSQKLSELVAQAVKDPAVKQRLLDNPGSLLQERGIDIPAGSEVRVAQDPAFGLYLEVNAGGAVTDLTAE